MVAKFYNSFSKIYQGTILGNFAQKFKSQVL